MRCDWRGKAIHEATAASVAAAQAFFQGLDVSRRPPPHRPADHPRDPFPARFPRQGRARLSHARPPRRNPQRRRIAARPPGQRAGLGPGRRVLRARRAFDRAASPRQPASDRGPGGPAGPRQHGLGRRTRRGDHAPRRLAGRPRPRRGAPRRADRRRRHAGRGFGQPGLAHRPLPGRHGEDPRARRAAAAWR